MENTEKMATINTTGTTNISEGEMPLYPLVKRISEQKKMFLVELSVAWETMLKRCAAEVAKGRPLQKAIFFAKTGELYYAARTDSTLVARFSIQLSMEWEKELLLQRCWELTNDRDWIYEYDILAKAEAALAAKKNEQ